MQTNSGHNTARQTLHRSPMEIGFEHKGQPLFFHINSFKKIAKEDYRIPVGSDLLLRVYKKDGIPVVTLYDSQDNILEFMLLHNRHIGWFRS